MERYFTRTEHTDVVDRMSEAVMRGLMRSAKQAVTDPENYDARAEIMWACKIAHDGTLGMGREEDWGSHQIEHELSAKYDVSTARGLRLFFRRGLNMFTGSPRNGLSSSRCASLMWNMM